MIDDVFQFILDYLHTSNNLIVWFACYAWICGTPPALMCIMLLVSLFRAGDGSTRQKGIYGDGNDCELLLLNIEVYIPV